MAEKKEGRARSPRKKKGGKYAPLLWVLTGAAIALFIAYSGNLKDKFIPSGQKPGKTNIAVSVSSRPVTAVSVVTQAVQPAVTQTVTVVPVVTNPPSENTVVVKFYLARQKGNEIILVERAVRIPKGASVLKDTLTALVSYRPDGDLLNLIPLQSVVRDVSIQKGVAVIDFNDAFNYNSYGVAGYTVQIYQVVHTATQFSSVKAVTFTINGKILKALGGEGYMVPNPVYPYSSLPRFPI